MDGLDWVFLGQGRMSAAALERLAAQRPQAVLTGRPTELGQPVADLARDLHLEVREITRLGDAPGEGLAGLGRPDVGVCCAWNELLRPGALAWPRHGWLNLHPSPLPRWRGGDPVTWQLLTGTAAIGCTVYRMSPRLDDGPIVTAGEASLETGDDRVAAYRRCGSVLGDLAAGVLDRLRQGHALPEQPQDERQATWCPPLGTVPLVDPASATAGQASRVANAFTPQPGIALIGLPEGARFGHPRIGARREEDEEAGTLRRTAEGAVSVACRDRWLHGEVWTV